MDKISEAIQKAKDEKEKPSIIKIRTHIAFGSPNKVDTAGAHGSPLGEDEVKAYQNQISAGIRINPFMYRMRFWNFTESIGDKGKSIAGGME